MLKPTRRHFALGAAAALALPATAWSQAYPNKPVRMLVGFAPGGPTDILARIVAVSLGRSLGQSVVVDNRAGAGGAIAAQALAKAEFIAARTNHRDDGWGGSFANRIRFAVETVRRTRGAVWPTYPATNPVRSISTR